MPIELTIQSTVLLSDIWMDKATWDEVFDGDLEALVELLEEDESAFLGECGGIRGLIVSAQWTEVQHAQES